MSGLCNRRVKNEDSGEGRQRMKILESETLIRDGYRFKHTKSWAITDNDGYVIKRFKTRVEAKKFILEYKEDEEHGK